MSCTRISAISARCGSYLPEPLAKLGRARREAEIEAAAPIPKSENPTMETEGIQLVGGNDCGSRGTSSPGLDPVGSVQEDRQHRTTCLSPLSSCRLSVEPR